MKRRSRFREITGHDGVKYAIRQSSAIHVVGPPGAGKTTLVASWLDARQLQGIWYQVDPGDADPASFFYYLGLAAQPFARKGQRPLPILRPEYLDDVPGFSRRFFRELFARLPEGSTLVLDNYQEVEPTHEFHRLVANAVDEMPPSVTVILVSRRDTPACYARLIANEKLASVDWGALKLTIEEAQAIASRKVQHDLALVERLHARTEGWAAGFTLMLESDRAGLVAEERPSEAGLEALFNYFADQILARISDDVHRFLLLTAYLPYVPVSVAERLTLEPLAGTILEDLCRRRLFTHRRHGAEPTYSYHALFRSFLLARGERLLSPEQRQEVKLQAACLLDAAGVVEEAMELYLDSGEIERAQALVLRQAGIWIRHGRWQAVVEWMHRLPEAHIKSNCWLSYWRGMAMLATDPEKARSDLAASFDLAVRDDDTLCKVQAAAGIVRTHMLRYTHFRPLDSWIPVLESNLARLPVFADAETELRVQSALLTALAYRQPTHPGLPACVERVFELVNTGADADLRLEAATHLLAYAAHTGPVSVGRRILPCLTDLIKNQSVSPLHVALSLMVTAWFHCLCREQAQCRAAIAELRRVVDESGLRSVAKWALMQEAWLELYAFRAKEGAQCVRRLEELIDPASAFDRAILANARSQVSICEGDAATALQYGLESVSLADESGAVMMQINYRISLVIARFLQRDFVTARQHIAEMTCVVPDGLTAWQRCALQAWEANIALEEGNHALACGHLAQALSMGRESGDDFMLSNWLRPWMPRLCALALNAGFEEKYVTDLIRRYDFAPPGPEAEYWPWPVKIYTLGEFRLERDGAQLVFGRKIPRKPIALLKALIAFGGREVPEGKLLDALWPEEDGDRAKRALVMALHRLRGMLGSVQAVEVRDHCWTLSSRLVWTDVRAFEIADGESAANRTVAQHALRLYGGPFLPGDDAEPWVLTPRKRLHSKFKKQLLKLTQELEALRSWNQAISWYLSGLEVEECVEEFYQGLMRCYKAQGCLEEAFDAYRRARGVLAATLGIKPSPTTEALARSLSAPDAATFASDTAQPSGA